MKQYGEKHYNIHLNIKKPDGGRLGFSVSYYASSLGEASRKAEADYPGALFSNGWILKSKSIDQLSDEAFKSQLTEHYGIQWGNG
jgi:hypothetical protein